MNTDSRTLANALALAPDDETRHRLLELAYRKVHLPSPTEFLTGPSYGNMRNLYPNVLRLVELILSPNVYEYYIEIGKGGGKAQPIDEPVLTPNGWKEIGKLTVGDTVFTGNGEPTKVIAMHPRGWLPVFKLVFDDGASTRCSEDHLWQFKDFERRFPRSKWAKQLGNEWDVKPLSYIRERWGDIPHETSRVAIPSPGPVQFVKRQLPLDPYLMGALLGDGGLTTGTIVITSADPEVLAEVQNRLPKGVVLRRTGKDPKKCSYRISRGRTGGKQNPVTTAIRNLGLNVLSHLKKIPEIYLMSGAEDRLLLLQGLMDTDGYAEAKGKSEFTSTSQILSNQVAFLVRSLGGKAYLRAPKKAGYKDKHGGYHPCRVAYNVTVKMPNGLATFRLPRKQNRLRVKFYTRNRILRYIAPYGVQPCVCISVEHPSGTYITKDFIVTHNSTIAAACVTYSAARLLALEKPHEFFSLQATKPIVCLTVATSEEQAKRTIFSQVKSMISHNPFFKDRANIRSTDIELDGGKVLIICGHSKSEGMEGHDVFFANIDEANKHGGGSLAGREQVRKLRDTFISSAESRFPFDYKVGCISSSVSMEDFQRQEIEWIRTNGRPVDFKTGKILDVADAGT